MRKAQFLILTSLLCLAAASPGPASVQNEAALAGAHLSAIMLIQRFAQAFSRVQPPVDRGCKPTDTGFRSNGDGTSTRIVTTRGCTRIVIRVRDDSQSDYTIDTTY